MLDKLNSYEAEAADEPDETQQPTTFKVKKTIQKNTGNNQIRPSEIGIQRLYELLEDAKNKQKLSTEDALAYTAMFNEWRSAKGNAKLKKEPVVGLREIYKRVL